MTAAHRIPQDAGPAPTSGSNLRLLPSAEDTLRAIERLLTAPNRYLYGTTDAFVVNTGEKTCSCAGCDALRAHGLTCAVCGFVGTPIVAPCSCVEMRRKNIAYAKREIRRITAGDVRPLDSSLDYYHRVLGEAVAWPNRMCTPPAPGPVLRTRIMLLSDLRRRPGRDTAGLPWLSRDFRRTDPRCAASPRGEKQRRGSANPPRREGRSMKGPVSIQAPPGGRCAPDEQRHVFPAGVQLTGQTPCCCGRVLLADYDRGEPLAGGDGLQEFVSDNARRLVYAYGRTMGELCMTPEMQHALGFRMADLAAARAALFRHIAALESVAGLLSPDTCLVAAIRRDGGLSVVCPYCGAEHRHGAGSGGLGAGDGTRTADCGRGSYFVVEVRPEDNARYEGALVADWLARQLDMRGAESVIAITPGMARRIIRLLYARGET